MTYEELLASVIKLQEQRDQWEQLAMRWKKLAQDRAEIIKQYEEIVQKALTPR